MKKLLALTLTFLTPSLFCNDEQLTAIINLQNFTQQHQEAINHGAKLWEEWTTIKKSEVVDNFIKKSIAKDSDAPTKGNLSIIINQTKKCLECYEAEYRNSCGDNLWDDCCCLPLHWDNCFPVNLILSLTLKVTPEQRLEILNDFNALANNCTKAAQ